MTLWLSITVQTNFPNLWWLQGRLLTELLIKLAWVWEVSRRITLFCGEEDAVFCPIQASMKQKWKRRYSRTSRDKMQRRSQTNTKHLVLARPHQPKPPSAREKHDLHFLPLLETISFLWVKILWYCLTQKTKNIAHFKKNAQHKCHFMLTEYVKRLYSIKFLSSWLVPHIIAPNLFDNTYNMTMGRNISKK